MLILGIDPGLDGACALIDHNGRADVFDIPTQAILGGGTVTRRVDARALRQTLRSKCPPGEPVVAVIESLSAGGRNSSAQTVGSQYRTRGAIEATLELLGLQPKEVHARTWKGWYGLTKDKGDSLGVARQLFPELAGALGRAKDHNRAESLLVARYAQRNLL